MINNKLISNTNYLSLSSASLTSIIVKSDLDKEFKINYSPSYSGFENFIFFGNAETITRNAIDRLIATYPINTTTGLTASESAFENAQKYINTYSSFERKVLEGFTNSVTGTYNGSSFTLINIPRNSDSSLYDIDDVNYVDGLLSDAELYDHHNKNLLLNFVPSQLVEYDEQDILANFMNMFGHVFDELKMYTDQFGNLFNTTNNYDIYDRPRPYDSYNLLTLFGFKVHTNFLFSNLINYLIQTGTKYSEKAIQTEVWDRILANLIYLYKSKGTIECLKAFLNTLGLNVDLVDIHEYVNFPKPTYIKTTKTVNYFELLFDSSVSGNISSSASELNLTGSQWSIVYNFDLKKKIQTQTLFGKGTQFNTSIIDASISSEYNEPVRIGYASLTANTVNGQFVLDTLTSSEIFYNYPKTLIINKTATQYELELSYLNINNEIVKVTATTSVTAGLSTNSDVFYLGRNGIDNINSFVGSAINFRVFNTALTEEQKIKYHRHLELVNFTNESISSNHVIANWDLNEPLYDSYRADNFNSITGDSARTILDSSTGFATGTVTGYSNFLNGGRYVLQQIIIPTEQYVSGLTEYDDKINIGEPLYRNTNWISLSINPAKSLNNAFEYVLGPIDFYDYFVSGDLSATGNNKYSGLEALKKKFYKTGVSIKGYQTLIYDVEQYAVGLFKAMKQFIPASAKILYMGLLIESPIYDRNKHIIRNADFDAISANTQLYEITQELSQDLIGSISGVAFSLTDIDSQKIIPSISADLFLTSISAVIEPTLTVEHLFDDELGESIYQTTITSTSSNDQIIDYLKNKVNIFNTYRDEKDILSPIDVVVAGIFDMNVSGYQTIYLSQGLTGETNLIFKYFDNMGDNIIGTRYELIQNSDNNKIKFEIIDVDESVTSSIKNQKFFMSDYDGSNLKFRFYGSTQDNNSKEELEEIKNTVVVKDKKKEFSIFIKWIPDIKLLYSPINIINDIPSIIKHPIIRWNLSTEMSTITAVSGDYGNLTSSQFTTSADFVAGSGLNILFNNYSSDVDGEISIKFGVSGQQNLFTLESQDILNEFEQVGVSLPIGSIEYETAVFFKQSDNVKRFVLPAGKTKKLSLVLATSAATSITAFTSGDIRFFTNQPKGNNTNKIFRLNFYAVPNQIQSENLPQTLEID